LAAITVVAVGAVCGGFWREGWHPCRCYELWFGNLAAAVVGRRDAILWCWFGLLTTPASSSIFFVWILFVARTQPPLLIHNLFSNKYSVKEGKFVAWFQRELLFFGERRFLLVRINLIFRNLTLVAFVFPEKPNLIPLFLPE
jgi:hypothetical protein